MKKYDVVVIGTGAGAEIAEASLSEGLKTAIVDKGPVGGTCLNVGCIPSKMIIFPADRVMEIRESRKLGIEAGIKNVDFQAIMERTRKKIISDREDILRSLQNTPGLDFYEVEARFIAEHTLQVGGDRIKGERVYIASGARPFIPPVRGLKEAGFITNESFFELKKRPESIIIIGGGYIAVEFAHFLEAMGTVVTILQRGERILANEEPEVSELLYRKLSQRMRIELNTEAVEVRKKGSMKEVVGRDLKEDREKTFEAQEILVAAGRVSNADILDVGKTGVKTDQRGYILVNEYLETNKKNIWALGDAKGREMFRHVANKEAEIVVHNSMHPEHKAPMIYDATPHAVFTHPQIASVGLTEEKARQSQDILIGKAGYNEVAKGEAMLEDEAFAKAIVDPESYKILGFHVIGPYAPIVIQEVVHTMANDQDIFAIGKTMHIHPALSELTLAALSNLEPPEK